MYQMSRNKYYQINHSSNNRKQYFTSAITIHFTVTSMTWQRLPSEQRKHHAISTNYNGNTHGRQQVLHSAMLPS